MDQVIADEEGRLSKDQIRNAILQYVRRIFEDRIEALGGQDLQSEVGEEVKAKFIQKFNDYFTTAFDFGFKEELQGHSSEPEDFNDRVAGAAGADLSVNDQQLQDMDNAIKSVSHRRKFYPARCSLFLDKTLKLQHDAEKKIACKVKAVEPLSTTEGFPADHLDQVDGYIQDQMGDLQSHARQAVTKAMKVERSTRILMSAQKNPAVVVSNEA